MLPVVRALFLIGILLSLAARAADGEDDIDREIGRQAAAKAIAEVLVTDEAYEAYVENSFQEFSTDPMFETESFEKAISSNPGKAHDALAAAIRQLISKARFAESITGAIADTFTYPELKQILAFVRTDVGKRYSHVAGDSNFQALLEKHLKWDPKSPEINKTVEREFKARFPAITFKFKQQ